MTLRTFAFVLPLSLAASCSSAPRATGFAVQNAPAHATAGDAVPLAVVQTFDDGSTAALPAGASVTWSGVPTVTALAPEGTSENPMPNAFFVANPPRPELASALGGVLFVRDPGAGGSLTLTGTLGGSASGTVSLTLAVGAAPAGDAARGATAYAGNCAACHGDTGHGSPANPDGSFTLEGKSYDFPAPGLNAETDNPAADPAWNAGVFAVAARAAVDDEGVSLRKPMPAWLVDVSPSTHALLSTQDLADIFAFLKTQTQ